MNYRDHPQTLTERRAKRDEDASKWTPRDALIHVLRKIDAGELHPDALVVMFRETNTGEFLHSYTIASPDTTTTVGLIARITHIIHSALGE